MRTRWFGVASVVAGAAFCFLVGFSWPDVRAGQLPKLGALLDALTGHPSTVFSGQKTFQANYSRIESDFMLPIEPKKLSYAAFEGMFASLGDPHTLFLPPSDAKEFNIETRGSFVGIGARMQTDDDQLGGIIATVFDGSPAQVAGLKEGDLVTQVDGVSMARKPIDDVVSRIRGKAGTVVKLTIVRSKVPKPLVIAVTRQAITTPTVSSNYLGDSQVGYVQVTNFAEQTADQFDREVARLEEKPLKGLVVDLRQNPGGLLMSASEMVSRFVADKVVVKMKFRDGHEEQTRSESNEVLNVHVPIVLLIDDQTASAAEIFAGCLHDYHIATMVGDHSYGKASVQDVFQLRDGSSAKVTIARYYLPTTADIGRKVDEDGAYVSGGLEPDVLVKLDPDQVAVFGDPKKDPQLDKALEIIRSKQ